MIYGLYLSAQGAEAQAKRLEVVANNLTNASTSAFKRDLAIFGAHRPHDAVHGAAEDPPNGLNESTGGVSLAEVATDFSTGPILETGGAYDVALVGQGFLQVADGENQFLTRNGRLTVNQRDELVTSGSGHQVLTSSGNPVIIPEDARRVEISSDGNVFAIGEGGARGLIGRLNLVQPESTAELQKVGDSLYRTHGNVVPADDTVTVKQGYLEQSGTSSVTEMMSMIQASRSYETNINMMKYQDEALGQLLGSMIRR